MKCHPLHGYDGLLHENSQAARNARRQNQRLHRSKPIVEDTAFISIRNIRKSNQGLPLNVEKSKQLTGCNRFRRPGGRTATAKPLEPDFFGRESGWARLGLGAGATRDPVADRSRTPRSPAFLRSAVSLHAHADLSGRRGQPNCQQMPAYGHQQPGSTSATAWLGLYSVSS